MGQTKEGYSTTNQFSCAVTSRPNHRPPQRTNIAKATDGKLAVRKAQAQPCSRR
jgi:hypothetical protein